MITRLRSRFPATCSRSGRVEGEYILSGEALSVEALQRSRSRVSYLEGDSDERGSFKDEEGESEPEERFYYRIAWGVDARTHTHFQRTIV